MDKVLSFGYCVRRRRKVSDLTQTELAGQVYCALSTIKKIELDERHPSRQMAERLAECPHEIPHRRLSHKCCDPGHKAQKQWYGCCHTKIKKNG